MKLIHWVLCGSVAAVVCVLSRADEPNHPAPAPAVPDLPAPAEIVLRTYPVGDLIYTAIDRPLGQGAVPPTQLMNGGELLGKRSSYSGGSGGGLFGNGRTAEPSPSALAAVAATHLIEVIEKEVDWGDGASIQSVDDLLVVRQTPAVHRQIAALLGTPFSIPRAEYGQALAMLPLANIGPGRRVLAMPYPPQAPTSPQAAPDARPATEPVADANADEKPTDRVSQVYDVGDLLRTPVNRPFPERLIVPTQLGKERAPSLAAPSGAQQAATDAS